MARSAAAAAATTTRSFRRRVTEGCCRCALARGGCLLAVAEALRRRRALTVLLDRADRTRLRALLAESLDALVATIGALDAREAQVAPRECAQLRAAALAFPGGFEHMTALVKDALLNWLADGVQGLEAD